MKNKLLLLIFLCGLIFLLRCKENVLVESTISKDTAKTNILGSWIPTKIETIIVKKNGLEERILDSSNNVKSYLPTYLITNGFIESTNQKSTYSILQSKDSLFIQFKSDGFEQKTYILELSKNSLILENKGIINDSQIIRKIYYKK